MSMFTHQCRCLPLRHVVRRISQTFLLLPDLFLGHAWLVKLMRYHFESHVTQIFPKDFVLFSLNDTYMFAWERVFCPRFSQTQSCKQKTPWERCFNKGQPRNVDAVGIRMTRLANQTRKKGKNTLYSRGGMGLLFSSGKHRISRVNTAFHR